MGLKQNIMITRTEKIKQHNDAKRALSKITEQNTFLVRVGTNIPTWVLPRVKSTKQQVIDKFQKFNNTNKENIVIT